LSAKRQMQPTASKKEVKLIDATDLKILIVDDNEPNRFLLKTILQTQLSQPQLYEAEDGDIAVKIAGQHHPQLIFMDIQMPRMSGIEATRLIRASEMDTENKSFIIALTAGINPGEEQKCLDAGMNYFMTKPVKIPQINELMLRYIESLPNASKVESLEMTEEVDDIDRIDLDELLKNLGGNKKSMDMMLSIFTNGEILSNVQELPHAIAQQDFTKIRHNAHAVKGSALSMCMPKLADLCLRLEKLAMQQQIGTMEDLAKQILHEVEWLTHFIGKKIENT
jgi:CheY-like chemotaxis protein